MIRLFTQATLAETNLLSIHTGLHGFFNQFFLQSSFSPSLYFLIICGCVPLHFTIISKLQSASNLYPFLQILSSSYSFFLCNSSKAVNTLSFKVSAIESKASISVSFLWETQAFGILILLQTLWSGSVGSPQMKNKILP